MELPDESLRERPLFILGHHRSGTSLLTHLLDGHPATIVAPYETYFFTRFLSDLKSYRRKGSIEELLREDLMRVWHPEHPYYRKYLSHIPPEEVWEAFWELLPNDDPPSYLSTAILAYGKVSGQLNGQNAYWVEKTPNNEHFIKEVFEYWPEARCIHILRDPRDLHTTLKKRASFDLAPRTAVHNWRGSYRKARENAGAYGNERYLVLRYEDLVQDPNSSFERIHAFLGIEPHPSEETPTLGGGKVDWKGNPLEGSFEGISSRSVGQWQKTAEERPREFRLIEAMLETEMKEMGYMEAKERPRSSVGGERLWQEAILKLKELREYFRSGRERRPVY